MESCWDCAQSEKCNKTKTLVVMTEGANRRKFSSVWLQVLSWFQKCECFKHKKKKKN